MAIYTCSDMIRDCRDDKPEGWGYFVTEYIPVVQALIQHYYADRSADEDLANRVLMALRKPDLRLFVAGGATSDREFVAELRQYVLAAVEEDSPSPPADSPLDLEVLSEALRPLTSTEKQVAWLETLRYDPEQTAAMMHMHQDTVEKIRERAAELLRASIDTWRRSLVADHAPFLRAAAAAARTDQCYPVRIFCDWLDGRITWYQRDDIDRHMVGCWSCIDVFCRTREVQVLLRQRKPLSKEQVQSFRKLLGVPTEKTPFWKRMMAGT